MSKKDTDDLITGILETVKTIAVVGASPKPERPSHQVMEFMQKRGYRVIPVNPGQAGGRILGEMVYADLADVPAPIDMVDIFRPSGPAGDVTRQAIRLAEAKGITVVWMQIGVANDAAKAEAEAEGLVVIQDRCPMKEIARLDL
ncbi:MAG: CoA-binding protein [Alphaproteobacteria bacterium]|nr:CoA-binding protein [Alphaproteobacteria bacterium]